MKCYLGTQQYFKTSLSPPSLLIALVDFTACNSAPLFLFDSAYTTAEAIASVDSAHVASKLEPAAARDVVRRLLIVDASKRDDGAALRNSKWLRSIDWRAAEARAGRGPLAKQAAAFADAVNSAEEEKKNMRPSFGTPFDVANKVFSNF